MCKSAVQLRGKKKFRICRRIAAPTFCHAGLDVAVKRSINLNRIEVAGEIFNRMLLSLLEVNGIDNALPILVSPACHADVSTGLCHIGHQ